jgi:hypothetical protein
MSSLSPLKEISTTSFVIYSILLSYPIIYNIIIIFVYIRYNYLIVSNEIL